MQPTRLAGFSAQRWQTNMAVCPTWPCDQDGCPNLAEEEDLVEPAGLHTRQPELGAQQLGEGVWIGGRQRELRNVSIGQAVGEVNHVAEPGRQG